MPFQDQNFPGKLKRYIQQKQTEIHFKQKKPHSNLSFSRKPNTNCHECTPKNKLTKCPNSHFTHKKKKKREMPFQAQTFLET